MTRNAPVPVIDFSAFSDGRMDEQWAGVLDTACADSGFFYINRHGLEDQLEEVWDQARWFFAQPPAAKLKVARSELNSRGFYNRELTKNTRDMKEVFDFGHVPVPGEPDDHPGNRTQDGWNQWPGGPGSDDFRRVMTSYYEACHGVALRLLEVVTVNLGAPVETLTADFSPHHSSFLRLNYYPLEDPLDGQAAVRTGHMGVHHHTDAGGLTLLLQDSVGGLEIHHRGGWIPVPPVPGALVVNIGDIVQVWSNDRYQAPLHRVVASARQDRYSLPYFFNPLFEATYAPLAQQTAADRPARYSRIHWGHFRQQRQHGDYGDYGDEIQIRDFRLQQGLDS